MKAFVLFGALVGLGLAAATPASAVALVGADKIVITNAASTTDPNLEYLQVGELLAIEAGTGKDVAAASNGGSASATSQYSPNDGPDKAIDGLYPAGFADPLYPSYPGPYAIYHSAGNNGTDALTVTFAPTDLGAIQIFGRMDCCQARDIYNISVFNDAGGLLYQGRLDASGPSGFATASFAPIPEPETWSMLIVGFGLLGFVSRGRRRAVAAIA